MRLRPAASGLDLSKVIDRVSRGQQLSIASLFRKVPLAVHAPEEDLRAALTIVVNFLAEADPGGDLVVLLGDKSFRVQEVGEEVERAVVELEAKRVTTIMGHVRDDTHEDIGHVKG